MDLSGTWRAAESTEDLRRLSPDPAFDDSTWAELTVPGHWRSSPHFASSDGPLLYRRHFDAPAPAPGRRSFLIFDGIFYLGDVWLDGDYLGDTEGYFFPHSFEVTDSLGGPSDHTLTVEVGCPPPGDRRSKRNLTGVFQHSDCIDRDWNPGGIWAPVHLTETGPVRLAGLKVLCREATPERAVLDLEATLDSTGPCTVAIATKLTRTSADPSDPPAATDEQEQVLSSGNTVVRWRVGVERPALWWPRALGFQPLYDIEVAVSADGVVSDSRTLTTGLRRIQVRNFIATVNGERLFLKGANHLPTRRALAEASGEEVAGDVALAAGAGLDLLHVQAHVARAELYEAADRAGMLIWQDLPLQWGYGNVRRQAVAQARQAVEMLGHHPSIAMWCGHNEPVPVDTPPDAGWRVSAGRLLPSWNRTALDRSIRRALERSDRSREVVAHSGVPPHPAGGTDSHQWFGWYRGEMDDLGKALSRLPVNARFVGEFGAQSVPFSDSWIDTRSWPALDWESLSAHHGLQVDVMRRRVPPSNHTGLAAWRDATQLYQARLVRHHVETLRRLKYRPAGGFCVSVLADCQPAISWALLDHERVPKAAYAALADACAPVIVTADGWRSSYRGGDRVGVAVHVVSDLRIPLKEASVTARLRWPGGEKTWGFEGEVAADSCVLVGRLDQMLDYDCGVGEMELLLSLTWAGGRTTNAYRASVPV